LLVASFLLSGCAPWSSSNSLTGASTSCLDALGNLPAPVTGVFVQPDDGYDPVLDEIEAARCTLDLNMYMLTDEPVFEALIAAVDRGVAVRVILEQHPFGMFGDQQEAFDRLMNAGAEVKWEPKRFQY
jgi:phosphatidylserine/phosphatidylglycerophosphate/cardiolipin synthase-like enzyme